MKENDNINIINTNETKFFEKDNKKTFAPDTREKYDIYIPLEKDDDDEDDDSIIITKKIIIKK